MRQIYLLFAVLLFTACKKDEVYGPAKLKNGQEVEVMVSHRYGATDDPLLLLPRNEPAQLSLLGFSDREPGYSYRVKARMVAPDLPPQDGPSYWLEFMSVLKKEKYAGNESFQLALIQAPVPSGPMIFLIKKDNQYYFLSDKVMLKPANETVKAQLEEIWLHNLELRAQPGNNGSPVVLKWRAITATVTHDPSNFGKAYLVSSFEFKP